MKFTVFLQVNYVAVGLFTLFVLAFIGLIVMYVYSIRLKRKARSSVNKFSRDLKGALDKMETLEAKLLFLKQWEERVMQEKKYEKNPDGRNMLLSKIYLHKASILFGTDRTKEVIEACTQILSVEPSHVQTYLNRGGLYSQIGEYEKGIEDLNHAELLDAHNPNIYNNRGWMYLQLEQYDKALSDLDHALSIQPTAIEYFNRGNVYKRQGALQKALDDYNMSLSMDARSNPELTKLLTDSITEIESNLKPVSTNN